MPEVLQHGLLYLVQVLSGIQIGEGGVPRFVLKSSQFDVFLHATCAMFKLSAGTQGSLLKQADLALEGAQRAACAVASGGSHRRR